MAIELADKLYTSTQVADILGVSLRTLYRYMEDDKIMSMRTASGRHRFTKDHIVDFLNAGRPDSSDMAQNNSMQNNNSPRSSGYANQFQNSGVFTGQQPAQRTDGAWPAGNSMSNNQPAQAINPAQQGGGFGSNGMSGQAWGAQPNEFGSRSNSPEQVAGVEEPQAPRTSDVIEQEDDFEFNVTDYDYDLDSKPKSDTDSQQTNGTPNDGFDNNDDFLVSKPAYQPQGGFEPQQAASQNAQPEVSAFGSPSTPPANVTAPADRAVDRGVPVSQEGSMGASPSLNIRYYKSDYTDLIELAKKIKDTSNAKDLEYAFTLYAGLSLHFLIRPFTVLNFYANPEDMQLWKDELRLVPATNRDDANVGIIINTDIVFVPTKEIGGFKVVEDKVLLKDLSASREEDLVKQFRQHLTSI